MPGKPSASRSASTSGVISAEVLRDHGQRAELGLGGLGRRLRPGPAASGRSARRVAPLSGSPRTRRSRGSGRCGSRSKSASVRRRRSIHQR